MARNLKRDCLVMDTFPLPVAAPASQVTNGPSRHPANRSTGSGSLRPGFDKLAPVRQRERRERPTH